MYIKKLTQPQQELIVQGFVIQVNSGLAALLITFGSGQEPTTYGRIQANAIQEDLVPTAAQMANHATPAAVLAQQKSTAGYVKMLSAPIAQATVMIVPYATLLAP